MLVISRKRIGLYVGIAAAIVILAMLFMTIGEKTSPNGLHFDSQPTPEASLDSRVPANPEKAAVHLYFADRKKPYLIAEERVLTKQDSQNEFAAAIVNELIKGSEQEHAPTIPANAQVKALFVSAEGVAYVDMTKALTLHHPGGIESELLTIYAIVNSIGLNVPGIKAVKILVDGSESLTLAGHIDLRYPFKTNMLLVR